MNTCNTDYISILNFWNCLRAYFWAYNRRTSPMLFVFQAQCSAQIKIKIKNIFETHNRWIYCWVPNIQTISFDLFFPHHPLYAERVLALGVAGDISVNYYSNKSLPVHYSFPQTYRVMIHIYFGGTGPHEIYLWLLQSPKWKFVEIFSKLFLLANRFKVVLSAYKHKTFE